MVLKKRFLTTWFGKKGFVLAAVNAVVNVANNINNNNNNRNNNNNQNNNNQVKTWLNIHFFSITMYNLNFGNIIFTLRSHL